MNESTNAPMPPRRSPVGTAVALFLVAAGIVSAIVITQRRHAVAEGAKAIMDATSQRAEALPVFGEVGDFALVNQDGNPVKLADLRGRVWVAEYFFTYCGGPCPRMNRNFGALHREFVGLDEPKFVSITCDPQRDDLDTLIDHARTQQADTRRWWFLRGEQRDLYELAQSLKLPYEIGNPSAHSTKFVLIDREAQIRGFYTGTDDKEVSDLRRDLRALLSAPPKG